MAAPGTGKTDTMAGKIVRLLEEGVSPDAILALSFSRLAATELAERLSELAPDAVLPRPRTLHSFALEELRKHKLYAVCGDNIIDDWEMEQFFRADLASFIGGTPAAAEKLLNAMQADWRTLKDEDAPLPVDRAKLEDTFRKLRPVFDFVLLGELVYRLKRWASKTPEYAPALQFILVDEYQDMNRCDQELIRLLQSRSQAELLVAGDDDQSIHGWRQANPDGIRDYPKEYSASDFTLTECWRCGQTIIDKAWEVISALDDHSSSRKKPVSMRKESGTVLIVAAKSAQSAHGDVAKLVKARIDAGATASGNVMVLVQRRYLGSRYAEAISKTGVSAIDLTSTDKLLDDPEIRRLLYVIRLKLNPADPVAFRALIRLAGGIGPAKTKPMLDAAVAGGKSLRTVVASLSDQAKLTAVLTEVDGVSDITTEMIASEVIRTIAGELGTSEQLLQQFLDLVDGIGDDVISSPIGEALTTLQEFRVNPQPAAKKDVNGPVRVMTMRQAKGLSAEVVIVTDLDDEIMPGSDDQDRIDEQRRTLYVSMTRAVRELYLFYCGTRTKDRTRFAGTGGRRRHSDRRTISRFLDETDIEAKRITDLLQ